MRIPNLAACFIVVGSLALSLAAQDRVRLTVSVTRNDGAPIQDLKKADFSVQDAGKPRSVESFVAPVQISAPAKLGPNEYSNAPNLAESSGAIFVVLDTVHTRYLDERDLREVILRFLARAAEAKHAVTLAILNDKGLRVYHDYHSGSDVLLASLVKAGLGGLKGGTAPPGVSEAEVTAEAGRLTAFSKGDLSNPTPQDQLMRSNIDLPLVMFQDIGLSASGLPGRKSLIWVTNAIPFDINPKTFQFVSPKTSNRGVAVGVSASPAPAGPVGLAGPQLPTPGPSSGGTRDVLTGDQVKRLLPIWRHSTRDLFDGGVAVYPVLAQGASTSGSGALVIPIMKTLAELTGGRAFYGTNDPFPEILQMSNGNTGGYVLGFAGDSSSGGEFHHVQASVDHSGLHIDAPAGYFPIDLTKSRPQDEIGLALQSPLEYTGISFRVRFTGEEDSGGKKKVNLTIAMPGDNGVLNEATNKVDLGIIAVATNAKGDTVGKLSEGAGGQFPPDAVAQIKEMGFELKRSIIVASAGDFTLRLVIRDNLTGRIGSLIMPLTVR